MDTTKYDVTREQLFEAEVPLATSSYSPVSNRQLIETIEEELDKHGLIVTGSTFKAADNNRMIGFYKLNRQNSDMGMMLGFGNSYDKSSPVKLSAGAQVFVCSNGCVSGEYMFKRKHTGSVYNDMLQFVSENIKQLDETFITIEKDFSRLKEVEVSKRLASELLGRMFIEEGIITGTQLNIIKQELEKPTYIEFKDLNGYTFYQYCTHALKTAHPNFAIKQLVRTHNFVTNNIEESVYIPTF